MTSKKFDPRRRLGDGILQMNRKELCALVSELCSRIRSEVETGRYHGGIYPENISLHRDGSVAIGPARTSNWDKRELAFVAPELYWDGRATEASDVYSLGLLLYYGVTGKLPFDGESQNSQLTRMSGREIPAPEQAGKSLGEVIAKATRYRPSERYQTVEQLQAMVESCLGNRYLNVEDSSQELFHKEDEELSDIERILVSILAEGDAEEKKPLERPAPKKEPAPEQDEGKAPPEETNESILQDIMQEMQKPEEEFTAEFRELELAGAIPAEKPAPKRELSDEELAALVASVFGPPEQPEPEAPVQPPQPEIPEPVKEPVEGNTVVITPVENIRVYEPNPGRKESAPASGREPIPILKEEKTPDLEPIVPQTQVTTPLPQYARNAQQAQQEEVNKRRKRPVIWVLAMCALLIIAAIVANAMLRDISSRRRSDVVMTTPYAGDASGSVVVPTAPVIEGETPSYIYVPEGEGEEEAEAPAEETAPAETQAPAPEETEAPAQQEPEQAAVVEEPQEQEGTQPVTEKGVSTYQVIWSDMSWTEARDACVDMGGHLVVINDQEELNQVVALMNAEGLTRAWIGGHRENDEIVWETGEAVDFYPWGAGEPSYRDSYDDVEENYLMLWYLNGWVYNDSRNDPVADYPQWYSGAIGYVCEIEG